jgi:DNA-binding transcriptional LysR family regulator
MVVMQSLVAAGMGVTTIPGLALRAHRHPAITATRLPVHPRRIFAATYGEPPDPPATAALVAALTEAAVTDSVRLSAQSQTLGRHSGLGPDDFVSEVRRPR